MSTPVPAPAPVSAHASMPATVTRPMAVLTLASFNTHYGLRPARRRAPEPVDLTVAVRRLDADVVVLQEAWRPDAIRGQVDEAAESLGYAVLHELTGRASVGSVWPHLVAGGAGTSGIAVLSRLPAWRVGGIIVGPTLGDPAPARTALHVELDVEGTPLRLVAVHLTSRLPHGPPIQLRRLARALPPPDVPAVVAGDCTFWGPGVRMFLRGWQRAVRGRTWPARVPHSQIDHVLVRPGIEVVRAEVLDDLGSDHLPVRVELRLPHS